VTNSPKWQQRVEEILGGGCNYPGVEDIQGGGLSRGGKIYCYLYDSYRCLDQQFLPFGICIISITGVELDTVCFVVYIY